MESDLIVLGDLVADLIIPIERLPLFPLQHGWAEGIFVEPGGAGNVLVAARRMNLKTLTLGAIGPDRYGSEMLTMLANEGVIVEHVAICNERATVVCIVLADQQGQHVYLGMKDKLGRWPFHNAWHAIIRQTRALFTDGYTVRDVLAPEDLLAAFDTARRAGIPIFYDPGPSIAFIPADLCARVLAATDVLLLTDEEAAILCGELGGPSMAQALLARGPTTVVLKHGAAGCSVATARGTITHPSVAVSMVDTVGAGDSFAAAFIAGWLRGGTLDDCAMLANAMGALTVTQRGAGTRIPARERLLALLANTPGALALA
ncbi:MAG: carbohydrate kinase family protein [Chloroflexota bacterium]|nr:carbohydrate kinase family protein [Chloroflexota bacterium]